MSDKELNEFMVWALQRYTMNYCLDHMDEVYALYWEDIKNGKDNSSDC